MTKKISIIILLAFIGLALSQCTTAQPENDYTRNRDTVKAIIKNFNSICYSMLKEEIQVVYNNYLSVTSQKNQSYEEFVVEYNSNKPYWKALFSGAVLKQISPVDNMASAIVVWGTGDSSLIELIKENDTWKINSLRDPINILRGTTVAPQ